MERQAFMRACQQGGSQIEGAVAMLYADYGTALWRDAWRTLHDAETARDLLQDTLLKVWRSCASFRGESELYPWLLTIVRRGAVDVIRRRHDEVPLEDAQGELRVDVESAWAEWRPGLAAGPAQQLLARQSEVIFRRCAAAFATEQPDAAAVVRWIAEDGLTPAQVAQHLGRSPGATREYISQCRKKARRYFAEWYAAIGPGNVRAEAA